jgi:hypothetical protein
MIALKNHSYIAGKSSAFGESIFLSLSSGWYF